MTAPTATRRVTPTAVRLLGADTDRAVWLDERRRNYRIGSSDVAAILGVTAARTGLHVWHDKRGTLPDDGAGEAALWGSLLEDPVAREWARRNRSVIHRVGLVAHHEHGWRTATLDRRVLECPLNRSTREVCALEVKCRDAHQAHRWAGDLPDDVLAQVAWQMHVTGYDHIHVAVLVGGNDYRQKVIRRDAALEADIVTAVTRWRDEHLVAGRRPRIEDPARAGAVIDLDKALHPDREGTVEIGVEDIGWVMEYAQAAADESAAKKRKAAAKAQLAQLADGHQVVTFADELAYEYRPGSRRSVDLDALAERWPDAYADVVTDTPTQTITIPRAYRAQAGDTR